VLFKLGNGGAEPQFCRVRSLAPYGITPYTLILFHNVGNWRRVSAAGIARRVRSSSPRSGKIFLFSTSFRPILKQTTQLELVPRSRMRGSIYSFRIRLHGVVLN
jgi:hypothetical protein